MIPIELKGGEHWVAQPVPPTGPLKKGRWTLAWITGAGSIMKLRDGTGRFGGGRDYYGVPVKSGQLGLPHPKNRGGGVPFAKKRKERVRVKFYYFVFKIC